MSTNVLHVEITQEKQGAVTLLPDNLFAELDFPRDLSAKGLHRPVKMGPATRILSRAAIVMPKALHGLSRAL